VDRYSFIVADFHRLLFAGLYRRTDNLEENGAAIRMRSGSRTRT
jgi:hypothetical protein